MKPFTLWTLPVWQRKVTGVYRGISNTGHRYALHQLACGHVAGTVKLKGDTQTCMKCGETSERPERPAPCKCGGFVFAINGASLNPHDSALWILPEMLYCEECEHAANDLSRIPDLCQRALYTRFRPFGRNDGTITFYARHETSPTGVMSIGGVRATKEAEALICSIRRSLSPLSPTER